MLHHLQEREDRRSAEGGGFEPLWPAESHFSREYVQDLVAEVEAALQQAATEGGSGGSGSGGSGSGSDMAAGGAETASAASGDGGVHPALLTDQVHGVYAAADGAQRAELARQADAMLLAGVPELASSADAAAAAQAVGGAASGPSSGAAAGGGSAALPALTAELPPAVLRSHWLLRLQLEWETALAEPFSLAALAERRRQRRCGVAGREGFVGGCCWLGTTYNVYACQTSEFASLCCFPPCCSAAR